ncbi:hypothetical protein OS493_024079 [Desmophyllum pertusum]|uniref:Uncharacterized protein n=1 Tax=Desmophyllum pertusum TaxID=174260 RepID=A0A9W9ZMF8_9CNID|nr:hypothetical protein OS493_024079 [Desmophyllum pertusum]
MLEDLTLALPEDSSESDSGTEDNESTAVDSAGLPGWDKVNRLAEALLNLGAYVTNAEVDNIKRLHADLDEYDRRALTFTPRYKKGKGRFKQSKNRSAHVGVESMARSFVTAGQPALSPSKSRVVEAICVHLCDVCTERRATTQDTYQSKWKEVIKKYNELRHTIANSRLCKETSLQLYCINETTLSKWFKNKERVDEVKMLLQGLAVPNPAVSSAEPLLPAQQLPHTPPRPDHGVAILEESELAPLPSIPVVSNEHSTSAGVNVSESSESGSRTTTWRHRKKKFDDDRKAAAKAEGLSTPKKKRMAYTCKTCNQLQSKETGHSQYFGQTYCPNEPGQITREEWLAKSPPKERRKEHHRIKNL